VLTLEFTIEPFVEGQPGPHVLQAIAAVEALGVTVEIGPFGSSCTVRVDLGAEVAGAVISAAFAHGASRVLLTADRVADADGVAS
jgi:uncharacterized protein YqgV (UPF0045/DUF77 family)